MLLPFIPIASLVCIRLSPFLCLLVLVHHSGGRVWLVCFCDDLFTVSLLSLSPPPFQCSLVRSLRCGTRILILAIVCTYSRGATGLISPSPSLLLQKSSLCFSRRPCWAFRLEGVC